MVQGIGENIGKAIKTLVVVAAIGLVAILGWAGYGLYMLLH